MRLIDRTIGPRADMDTLSITEINQFTQQAKHARKMHACGHDDHTTFCVRLVEKFRAR